jgi:heme-degrading monooxygenase HmoA
MYLVREVFNAKPGKAKELVKKFKLAAPYFEKEGMKGFKLMTDIATTYWTVVVESETEDLNEFLKGARSGTPQPEVQEIMEGYMDLLEGGHREIYLIE